MTVVVHSVWTTNAGADKMRTELELEDPRIEVIITPHRIQAQTNFFDIP
jgi:hypothetical protein